MEKLVVNWENMDEYTAVPMAYRFVDEVVVTPGEDAIGTKLVSSLDWYFKIHFPGNPIMPGVFLMEAMQQTGSFIITTMEGIGSCEMLFQSCRAMRIYKAVRPGDILKTAVKLKSYRHGVAVFSGEAKIHCEEGEILACVMEFTLVLQKELLRIEPQPRAEVCEGGGNGQITAGSRISVCWSSIGQYLVDPPEYRFIDHATVAPGQEAWGRKHLSSQDWYFGLHYPKDPMMPAGFLLEAMMQTGVLIVTARPQAKDRFMMFQGCRRMEAGRIVRPGNILRTHVMLLSYRRGVGSYTGEIYLEEMEEPVCRAEFSLVMPTEMTEIKRQGSGKC